MNKIAFIRALNETAAMIEQHNFNAKTSALLVRIVAESIERGSESEEDTRTFILRRIEEEAQKSALAKSRKHNEG